MEVELKYAINSKEVAQQIWEDEDLRKFEESESREIIFMKAIYFDTANYDLSKNDIAYRVRSEGDKLIASLKWGGKTDGALHTREEINVPVKNRDPNPATFEESDIGKELISILSGKELDSIMEVKIERRRFRMDTETSIVELSIDSGEIITDNGTSPVCEVELELFSGDQEELLGIGKQLAEKYDLVSEKRSKFYRGLVMTGQRS